MPIFWALYKTFSLFAHFMSKIRNIPNLCGRIGENYILTPILLHFTSLFTSFGMVTKLSVLLELLQHMSIRTVVGYEPMPTLTGWEKIIYMSPHA